MYISRFKFIRTHVITNENYTHLINWPKKIQQTKVDYQYHLNKCQRNIYKITLEGIGGNESNGLN